jgi:AraC-like DNA-binding protein
LSGGLDFKHDDLLYSAETGDCLLLPAGDYSVRISSEVRVCSVGCEVLGQPEVLFGFATPLLLGKHLAGPLLEVSRELIEVTHQSTPNSSFWTSIEFVPATLHQHSLVQAALWKWFSELLYSLRSAEIALVERPDDPRIARLLQLLAIQPLDCSLPVEHLEKELGLSWRRLEQLFKAAAHMTPSQYFEQRRIWAAYKQLSTTSAPVKEVAYGLGFKQPTNFSRWFMESSGMSPSQFRAKLKAGPII